MCIFNYFSFNYLSEYIFILFIYIFHVVLIDEFEVNYISE